VYVPCPYLDNSWGCLHLLMYQVYPGLRVSDCGQSQFREHWFWVSCLQSVGVASIQGMGRRATGSSRAGAGTAVVGYSQAGIPAWTGRKHFKVQVFSASFCELQVSGRTHRGASDWPSESRQWRVVSQSVEVSPQPS
jgi:hypothetical protein